MKIVTNVAEYIDYFRQLAKQVPGINSFVWGSSDMILSLDRSDLDMPCLWLEIPEIDWQFKEDLKEGYDTSFTILKNIGKDDWDRREEAFNHTGYLTKNTLKKINEDRKAHIINVDLSRAKSFPIDTIGANGDKGWRTQGIIFNAHGSDCLPEEMENTICPIGTLPKFWFHNGIDGNFNGLTISNQSLPKTTLWEYEWKYSIDNGPVQTSTAIPPIMLGTGSCIYIQLKITSESCIRYASAEISNTINSGYSVPYQLKKLIE